MTGPEQGAPPGRTHRVYAIEGGRVRQALRGLGPWKEGVIRLGHFGYGHVDPVVAEGDQVEPGQMIGWTTEKEWHVHLSEWHLPGGDWDRRVPVNPLDRAGKLAPYVDTAPPVIHDIRFTTPSDPGWRVGNGRAIFRRGGSSDRAHTPDGLVDVRARIEDPVSVRGWFRDVPDPRDGTPPGSSPREARPARGREGHRRSRGVQVRRDARLGGANGRTFADPVLQPLRAGNEAEPARQHGGATRACPARASSGFASSRVRAASTGTRRTVRNGPYRLTVKAWDVAGNRADASVDALVQNP